PRPEPLGPPDRRRAGPIRRRKAGRRPAAKVRGLARVPGPRHGRGPLRAGARPLVRASRRLADVGRDAALAPCHSAKRRSGPGLPTDRGEPPLGRLARRPLAAPRHAALSRRAPRPDHRGGRARLARGTQARAGQARRPAEGRARRGALTWTWCWSAAPTAAPRSSRPVPPRGRDTMPRAPGPNVAQGACKRASFAPGNAWVRG